MTIDIFLFYRGIRHSQYVGEDGNCDPRGPSPKGENE